MWRGSSVQSGSGSEWRPYTNILERGWKWKHRLILLKSNIISKSNNLKSNSTKLLTTLIRHLQTVNFEVFKNRFNFDLSRHPNKFSWCKENYLKCTKHG